MDKLENVLDNIGENSDRLVDEQYEKRIKSVENIISFGDCVVAN